MDEIVILLLLSVAAFGQECEKKGPNAAEMSEWKLTCNEDNCAFENEEELKKEFAALLATKLEKIASNGNKALDITTQVTTSSTLDSSQLSKTRTISSFPASSPSYVTSSSDFTKETTKAPTIGTSQLKLIEAISSSLAPGSTDVTSFPDLTMETTKPSTLETPQLKSTEIISFSLASSFTDVTDYPDVTTQTKTTPILDTTQQELRDVVSPTSSESVDSTTASAVTRQIKTPLTHVFTELPSTKDIYFAATSDTNDVSEAFKVTARPTSPEPMTAPPLSTKSSCRPPRKGNDVIASSNTSCSQSSFTFPNGNQTTDYVLYNGTFPALSNFSICAWLSPKPPCSKVKGSLLSYCEESSKNCKSLNIMFYGGKRIVVYTHYTPAKSKNIGNIVKWDIEPIISRFHFCVTASTEKKFVGLFINGKSVGPPRNFTDNWKVDIPPGRLLVIGHEQDLPKGHPRPYLKDAHQAFVGKIEDLNLWNRILNETEIQKMNQVNCSCPDDAILTINQTMVEVKGNVNASYSDNCI